MYENGERLPVGTKVKVVSLTWGESDKFLYDKELIDKRGEVIDHDNDRYTPPNVVEINGDKYSYFLPNECLEIIKD